MIDRIDRNFQTTGVIALLLSIFLAIALGLLTMLFFKNIIKSPMEAIREGIETISSGNLDAWIRLDRHDEWSLIENALNTMAFKLSVSYTELKKAHDELTRTNRQLRQEIDERRRAEQELNKHREHLEELVRGRTAQLEASNKELEGFTYSVSHDLRAPLRHIDGFLELLQKKVETVIDEQGRHYMNLISDAARKMGQLIDDLLSFSRMGRHLPSFHEVAMEALVRDILREFEPDTSRRKIDWRIGDLPVVRGDEAMLRTVLVNLISNALKFTRPREKARIEIGSLSDQTTETVIFVRDNGVGFDMTYADKLFGVFQRLHRSDEFEGTGIGLANVQRIIDRHGGRTWADSKPDQGAAFFFSLPHTLPKGGVEK